VLSVELRELAPERLDCCALAEETSVPVADCVLAAVGLTDSVTGPVAEAEATDDFFEDAEDESTVEETPVSVVLDKLVDSELADELSVVLDLW